MDVSAQPETISIKNQSQINNAGGHIQGVQGYVNNGKRYFIFSGSSNDHAYYAVADADMREIIQVDTFLKEPFRHAGGFQIVGNLLAVGVEDNDKKDKSKVLLYRIVDAEKGKLQLLKNIDRQGAYKRYTAGCVAMLIKDENLLLAVGNWDTQNIDFYSIALTHLDSPEHPFRMIYSLDTEQLDMSDWVEQKWYPYQNINFLQETGEKTYLIGMGEHRASNREVLDMYELISSDNEVFTLKKIAHSTYKKTGNTSFRWGGGIVQKRIGKAFVLSCEEHIKENIMLRILPLIDPK